MYTNLEEIWGKSLDIYDAINLTIDSYNQRLLNFDENRLVSYNKFSEISLYSDKYSDNLNNTLKDIINRIETLLESSKKITTLEPYTIPELWQIKIFELTDKFPNFRTNLTYRINDYYDNLETINSNPEILHEDLDFPSEYLAKSEVYRLNLDNKTDLLYWVINLIETTRPSNTLDLITEIDRILVVEGLVFNEKFENINFKTIKEILIDCYLYQVSLSYNLNN